MASHVFVLDSTFKRTQIKVTPGLSLREVLEEACKSRRLNPEVYALKTQNNKTLDLSQPFRLSGLSAGAKLQLVQASKSPGVVSVALQLPESEGSSRLSDKFPSNTSLWLILRKFEDAVAGGPASKLNLTQRGIPSNDSGAGRLLYEQPCLHVANRNYETVADLQKTLAQLGLNGGSALLRLNFKRSEQPLEDAMMEISKYFNSASTPSRAQPLETAQPAQRPNEVADNSTPAVSNSENTDEDVPTANTSTKDDVEMKDENNVPVDKDESELPSSVDPSSQEPEISNGISVYRPPSSSTPAAALQADDPSEFEPTIDHAKAHQAALSRAGRNQRLLSDKELAEQEAQRQETVANVRTVTVRVRYPDQSQIETNITASDTAAILYDRVAQTLAADANEPFELRYVAAVGNKTHHQTLPRSAAALLVRDAGFRGKMMVTLVWGQEASLKARQPPSLKEEYRRQAKDLKVDLGSSQKGDEGQSSGSVRPVAGNVGDAGEGASSGGKKIDVEARMKRFLGFGMGKK